MWDSGQNTETQETTKESMLYLGYRYKSIAGLLAVFVFGTPREICMAQQRNIRNGCLVSTLLGNEQEMLFVNGLGGYYPAAKKQRAGAQMGSDTMLGRLGGQRLSLVEEKSRIGRPRWH